MYHDYQYIPPFSCAYHSLWFLIIFVLVSFFGSLILTITENNKIINIILAILLLIIIYCSYFGQIFEYTTYKTLFYLFIFLIGHQLKNIKLTKVQFSVGITTLAILVYYWFSAPIYPLIAVYKFPPGVIYLTVSGFSILTALFLKTRVKIKPNNIFLYPGRESLFFYFGQAITITITSGLIVLLVEHSVKWYLVFLLGSTINIAITYLIAIILKYIDSLMWKGLKRIPIPRK